MRITRRDFLTASTTTLVLGPLDLHRLEQALGRAPRPRVVWLQGAGCTGCSISLLNHVSTSAPETVTDVLIDTVDLVYHPTLMAAAGHSAAAVAREAFEAGNYILVIEGGVPTAFDGNACWVWKENGRRVTFQEAVTRMASRATAVVCVGTCAAWGGVPAAGSNPTAVKGAGAVLERQTINIGGCPPHPDWIVWTLAHCLTGSLGALDAHGRPLALFKNSVHALCARKGNPGTGAYGDDARCVIPLGCRGPKARGNCPTMRWNGGANWCVDANTLCIGCTEPTFPVASLRGDLKAVPERFLGPTRNRPSRSQPCEVEVDAAMAMSGSATS